MPTFPRYNWQFPDWPNFTYNLSSAQASLEQIKFLQARLSGLAEALPESLETEAVLDLMIAEAVRTSSIEGEHLDRESVVSSIRNHLGLNHAPVVVSDRKSDGAGELMVSVRKTFNEPLEEKTLHAWQTYLMRADEISEDVGQWRHGNATMQIISGRFDRPTVHFEAPPPERIPPEMTKFIRWFNRTSDQSTYNPIVRAALAHLHFESIHPYEDGNGRIGRAIAEKALSQGATRPLMISLSSTIAEDRAHYYKALENAQQALVVTEWIDYFVNAVLRALQSSENQITFIATKARFYDRYREALSERQSKIIARMFKAGPAGFHGGINARKYVSMAKVSKATATRDLQHLSKIGAITATGGGRSTSYALNI